MLGHVQSPKVNPPGKAATKITSPASPKRADGEAKKKGGPPKDIVKKPKLSKAERRALQEKQRADKAAKEGGAPKKPKQVSSKIQADDQSKSKLRSKKLRKAGVPERKSNQKQVELFSHLRQYVSTSMAPHCWRLMCAAADVVLLATPRCCHCSMLISAVTRVFSTSTSQVRHIGLFDRQNSLRGQE